LIGALCFGSGKLTVKPGIKTGIGTDIVSGVGLKCGDSPVAAVLGDDEGTDPRGTRHPEWPALSHLFAP
jgi:hypothetical protein